MLIHVKIVLRFLLLRLEQFRESQTPVLCSFDLVFASEDLCQSIGVITPVDIRFVLSQYPGGSLPREPCHIWVAVDLVSNDRHPLNRLRIVGITTSEVLMEPIDHLVLSLTEHFSQLIFVKLVLSIPRCTFRILPIVQLAISVNFRTNACGRNDWIDVVSFWAADNLDFIYITVLRDVFAQVLLMGLFDADCITDDSLHFEALLDDSRQHRERQFI